MKNLLFSLIFLSCIVPSVALALTAPRDATTTKDTSGAGGNPKGSLAEEWYKINGSNDAATAPASIKDAQTGEIKYKTPDGGYYPVGAMITDSLGNTVIIGPNGALTRVDSKNNITYPNQQPQPQQPPKTPTGLPTLLDKIVPFSAFEGSKIGDEPLNKLFNQLFYIGLVAAIILAIVMIIRGGVEYMTIDAIASKENGKNRVKAALGGLLLAFSAILILNTINPGLTSLKLVFPELTKATGVNIFSGLASGTRNPDGTISTNGQTTGNIPTGSFGSWNESGAENWVNGLPDGSRANDGSLNVSVYSATGDAITDSNTAEKRGNADNLLREGSVALSPDLIAQYKPQTGQEVFINGTSVGFYEDATAGSYGGTKFSNTIDIYDQNKSLNWSGIKNVPPNQWKITFGNKRPQISNP